MSLSNRHPLYTEFAQDWVTMRDTFRGSRVVKGKAITYLPPTSGMVYDGMMSTAQPGYQAYTAYLTRAVFPDFVAEAVEALLGTMHSRPPVIELPPQLEPLRERATINGETLEHLLRRINEQQLVAGRLGLLLDLPVVPDQAEPLPYIALYRAETIVNWDDNQPSGDMRPKLNMVVLDESELERRSDFSWETVEKFRVVALCDPDGQMSSAAGSLYATGLFKDKDAGYNPEGMVFPSIRGNVLDQLPFVLVNTKDLVSSPDDPPLLGLANLALAVYRGEADYRQNLFMQGQDTFVIIGDTGSIDDDTKRVGAGALLRLPQGGDAKYVGVGGSGLAEQRQALENDRNQAMVRTGALLHSGSAQRESGDALRIRVAAQTASLNTIAQSGAAGLEHLLRVAAEWVGADPMAVNVRPNLEFTENTLDGKSLVDIMSARTMGAPISLRSVHGLMRDRGLTKLEYEEELDEIESEPPPATGGGTEEGGDPEDEADPLADKKEDE